ncbi:MAG: hypothetical protein M3N49_07240 [Candidatus Eremiobacteraeota bacterium]|nr:hypothetical protein [Candidatus Eremiobacteraeota bacterium]
MRSRKFRGLTFITARRAEATVLRLDGVLEISVHKAGPPLRDIERAASHAIDSARLEGVTVEAAFLHDVIDAALRSPRERVFNGSLTRREE